jgi:hypothetical protein
MGPPSLTETSLCGAELQFGHLNFQTAYDSEGLFCFTFSRLMTYIDVVPHR